LDVLVERYLRALRERRPFHRALFASIMHTRLGLLKTRTLGQPGRVPQPNSTCVPGHPMVFVSGDGALHPCCNFSPAGSEIGDCRSGIDIDKAQELLQAQARLCNRLCQDCWAWRICSHCFIQSVEADGRPSPTRKEAACAEEKQRVAQALRRYAYLLQNEPAWAARVKDTLRYSLGHPEA
jgi:radical SAM protein with 4Fe4S-binding SPASM domain